MASLTIPLPSFRHFAILGIALLIIAGGLGSGYAGYLFLELRQH